MGLALLANLSAYDFGYISAGRLVDRTARAFQAMSAMERHRGHFYNWYDTQSLAPLEPRYISSVDSGNLAGHLLTLRPGLLALRRRADPAARDVPRAARHASTSWPSASPGAPTAAMTRLQKALDAACDSPPDDGRRRPADPRTPRRGEPRAGRRARDGGRARGAAAGPSALADQCRDVLRRSRAPGPVDVAAGLGDAARAPARVHLDPDAQRAGGARRRVGRARPGRGSRRSTASRRRRSTSRRWSGSFLFDRTRHLLSIGYNVADRRRDSSYYDLLASEARLCTFVAIAQGHLPQESWFALGRLLTTAAGEPVLLSWSGSMFEYLMPLVVMPGYDDTLLDQTCKAAVKRQIEYGRHRGVPWGISESGLQPARRAAHLPVPRVRRAGPRPQARPRRRPGRRAVRVGARADGVARGGVREPAAARGGGVRRGARLLRGDRLHAGAPAARPVARRRALLHGAPPGHDAPVAGARAPRRPDAGALRVRPGVPGDRAAAAGADPARERVLPAAGARVGRPHGAGRPPTSPCASFSGPDTPAPEVQLLSNGRYHVVVTNAGGGYSRWKDLAVTRWREDATSDNWGTFCYLRDVATGAFWSAAHQPTLQPADRFEAVFSEARAEFRSRTHQIESYTEIAVSPEDDVELRRLRLTNCGRTRRTIEVTSYAEVALATPAADALHPAFSNLFVQTEIVPDQRAILCTRRPRSRGESSPWMFHLMAAHGAAAGGALSYETDRLRFVGRGRTPADPRAMHEHGPLSGTAGVGARSDRRDPRPVRARTGRVDHDRRRLGRGRDARGVPGPGGQVPGPAARQSRVRAGLDARPGRPAAAERQRGGCAALLPPGRLHHLREPVAARRPGHHRAGTGAGSPGCGATRCPATCRSCCCRSATRPTSSWCASSCRPTPTGA